MSNCVYSFNLVWFCYVLLILLVVDFFELLCIKNCINIKFFPTLDLLEVINGFLVKFLAHKHMLIFFFFFNFFFFFWQFCNVQCKCLWSGQFSPPYMLLMPNLVDKAKPPPQIISFNNLNQIQKIFFVNDTQSAGAVEYANCTSAEG